ncbi:MAG: tRNA lysidine(34) synthetase TilS [Rickettsiales bacterium]|jgi:tRNA(Ile)-lysidine synthase|nr:tRNA lysidine(34) synthetase TilS [Rickettsiales bacterium]
MTFDEISSSFESCMGAAGFGRALAAVSGGSDSLALLLSFGEWSKKRGVYVEAITVDHGLRPSSSDEAEYVRGLCEKIGIKHTTVKWVGDKPTSNIESTAREARYSLIGEYYRKNNFDCLLTAHHLNDQAETFFLRLFRGSGIDGLACMGRNSFLGGMNVIRPFLNIPKDALRKYLEEKKIKWIEDESNNDEKFLRNRIRAFLNSLPDRDKIAERINFATEEIAKAKRFIVEEFEKHRKNILNFSSFGSCAFSYAKLAQIDGDMSLRLLAHAAMKISGNAYKPRLEKLKNLLENIKKLSPADNFKTTFYGCVFEKFEENLIMVYREYNSIGEDKKLIFGEKILWDGRFSVELLANRDDISITHLENGKFTELLRRVKEIDPKKYRELREIRGIQKNIFYTLPLAMDGEKKYLIGSGDVSITF